MIESGTNNLLCTVRALSGNKNRMIYWEINTIQSTLGLKLILLSHILKCIFSIHHYPTTIGKPRQLSEGDTLPLRKR